jgi:alpha-D-xyloside xylohydrolase
MRPALVFAACVLLPLPAAAQPPARPTPTPAVLQTSALVLEVSRPYRYKLTERATGRVLVSHSETRLRIGDAEPELRGLTALEATATTLEGKLGFSNTSKTARVRFTFTTPEILQVLITYDGPLTRVTEELEDQGEHYYGLWEYPTEGGLDNRGADEEMLGLRHLPEVNYPSARAPFYVTSRGYGIYAQSDGWGRYKVAVKGKTSFSFAGDRLQYSVIYGPSYLDVLRRYNDLAGGAFMPPLWAFDSIWWRDDHHRDLEENGVKNAQELVLKDAQSLQEHRIPAGGMWIDRPYGTGDYAWGNMDFDASFPDPLQMVKDLDARGMKLALWIANRAANKLLADGRKGGHLFSEDVYTDWPAADVRAPRTYEWFKQQLGAYARLGILGYKIDRGEEGETPDSEQNRIITLFAKLAKEGIEERSPGESLVFARNVYDTGRKYAAVWNGDTVSQWSGLVVSVKSALRCGAIDMPMWGSDVGGYFRGKPTKELLARWLQLGAYSSLMEVKIEGGRTPWIHYDDEMIAITRAQAAAHHDLIPYARSAVHLATRMGLPVMRQLLFDHPDDKALLDMWDEYMFGPSILVAPVTADGVRKRPVYLPEGRWLDYNDRKSVYAGGTTVSADAPLGRIPLFVPEGAIIPRGDILKSNNSWVPDWKPYLRIEIFAAREGQSAFEYFTGTDVQKIACSSAGGRMTIVVPDLKTNGTLEVYLKARGRVLRDGVEVAPGRGQTFDAEGQVLTLDLKGSATYTIEGMTSLF